MIESFQAICDLVKVLERHDLNYLVGGSVCSSIHGVYRSTNDIDVLLERGLKEGDLALAELNQFFILDPVALVREHAAGRCFNIFHEETALKIDLFPATNLFHASEISRAISVQPSSSACSFKIASAEDIIIAKLAWFAKSRSERQENDIKSVIATSRAQLDLTYLKKWADSLGLAQELEKLLS